MTGVTAVELSDTNILSGSSIVSPKGITSSVGNPSFMFLTELSMAMFHLWLPCINLIY